jgi:hypothetical protein
MVMPVVPDNVRRKLGLQGPNPNTYFFNLSRSVDTNYRNIQEDRDYDDDIGYDLLRLVGMYNKDIGFDPYLTNLYTAESWLLQEQAKGKYKDCDVVTENLDNNTRTPDDVIIVDENRIPRFVSRYYVKDGKKRRKAAILNHFYPTKGALTKIRNDLKRNRNVKLFNKWLTEQSNHANEVRPFNQNWYADWLQNRSRYRRDRFILDRVNNDEEFLDNLLAQYFDSLFFVYPKLVKWVYRKHRLEDDLEEYVGRLYRNEVIREQIRQIYIRLKSEANDGRNKLRMHQILDTAKIKASLL